MKNLIKGLLSMSLMALAFQAQATVVDVADPGNCSTSADLTTSTECVGVYDPGNDHGGDNIFEYSSFIDAFGTGWTELVKNEEDPDGWNATNPFGFSITNPGTTSGTWTVSTWGGYGEVLAILKAGQKAAAYDVDLEYTTGNWNIESNAWRKVNQDGSFGELSNLSHFTFWGKGASDVPEPAMISLLGLGLLGIAAVRRRKMKV